jgi:nitrogen-specific signal transduction histidine kinase
MERMREAIRTREAQIDSRQVRKEDGETRYEDVSVYPLVANGIEGAVIRVDDVTEQVRVEEMMVQSEKMLSVGGLAAGMAHEINNPLAGMMQTAEVLTNRLTQDDLPANIKAAEEAGITMEAIRTFMEKRKIIDMLGHIRESGSRAAEIVSNMLFFARKSDASWPFRNLADLLDQIVELAGTDYDLKKKYDFRRIKIVREYENDLPLVPCESGKIQQVLLNILRNGAEAMQEYPKGSRQEPP